MKKYIQLLGLFALLIFTNSCLKHGESLTINAFLTNRSESGKKWYVRKVFADDQKSLDCLHDDVWTFSADEGRSVKGGWLTIEAGFMKCSLDDQDREFEYMLGANNEKLLYVTYGGNFTQLFEIVEISENFLAIEYRETDHYGIKSTLIRYEFQSK